MTCLDENTVLAFVDGQLSAAARSEVEKHLAGCNACIVLVSLAASRVTRTESGVHHERATPAPRERGSSIGRYVILDLVGRGGMGEVYAAYDPELDRRVALKVLDETGEGGGRPEVARARLLREAKVIAKLSHPNVVVVHDAGTVDDRVFIAMEFIQGMTLSDWLKVRPRAWPEIRAVFVAAGRGLMAAHAADLVHRDFKPQNVMVGDDGSVRVMDFGLAKDVLGDRDGGDAVASSGETETAAPHHRFGLTLTRTGTWLGTPRYMAPEQFRAEKADPRTDQYSFCVALHEAVYGERPFRSGSLLKLREEVLAGQIGEPPARSRVPPRLRKIILRGLSVDRGGRFPSMGELLAALERDPTRTRRRVLAGALIALMLAGGGAVAQRTAAGPAADLCQDAATKLSGVWELAHHDGQHPRRTAAQKAFLATGTSHVADSWERSASRLDEFAQRWTQMHKQSCEATHKSGEQSAEVLDLRTDCLNAALGGLRAVTDLFIKADAEVVGGALNAADALPDLNRCADTRLLRAVIPPPANREQHGRIEDLDRRAAAIRALGDIGKWHQSLREANTLVQEAQSTAYPPLIAEALFLRGRAQAQTGDGSAAMESYRLAFPAAVSARDDLLAAQVTILLAGAATIEFDRSDEGSSWAAIGEAFLTRTGVGGDRTRGWLFQIKGHIEFMRGRFVESVAFQRQAAEIIQKAAGREVPDVAISLNNVSTSLMELRDNAGALEESTRASRILEREVGPDSSTLAGILTNQGDILNRLGRPAEARLLFDRSITIWRESVQPDSPWFAYPLTGIGQGLLLQNKPADAVAPLERALALREKGDPAPERLGETRFALARALWGARRDRTRAQKLAAAARADYVKKPAHASKVADIDRWLESL